MRIELLMLAVGVLASSQTFAAEDSGDSNFLNRVESPVFQTVGTHEQIAKRATICIAQVIKPGFTTAPTIVSSDPDAGMIVANNAFKYSNGFLLESTARTTMTFEAKDGRFRIVHTNIERFDDGSKFMVANGWGRIGTWWGSGGDAAKSAIDSISQSLADCVMQKPNANDSW